MNRGDEAISKGVGGIASLPPAEPWRAGRSQ
jgi:hypothetical protein